MNNTYQRKDYQLDNNYKKVGELKIQKEVIKSLVRNYSSDKLPLDDYVYDDFPEEIKQTK